MANIRPSSDLRNHYNEISEFCNKSGEPVYITKNGRSDLVVLSNAEYERIVGRERIHKMLDNSLNSLKNGDIYPMEEVFSELEREFGLENL